MKSAEGYKPEYYYKIDFYELMNIIEETLNDEAFMKNNSVRKIAETIILRLGAEEGISYIDLKRINQNFHRCYSSRSYAFNKLKELGHSSDVTNIANIDHGNYAEDKNYLRDRAFDLQNTREDSERIEQIWKDLANSKKRKSKA